MIMIDHSDTNTYMYSDTHKPPLPARLSTRQVGNSKQVLQQGMYMVNNDIERRPDQTRACVRAWVNAPYNNGSIPCQPDYQHGWMDGWMDGRYLLTYFSYRVGRWNVNMDHIQIHVYLLSTVV